MHARLVRSAAAIAVAAAGTLTWAPAASAEPSEPSPSASATPAETPAPDAGSVEITTKDTDGDALPGAVFLLLDSAGQEAGHGKTDAQGKLTFSDLAPGVYRLKETASGSPLHEAVGDQDVIVTPGATTRLTITDPFKAAKVLLQAKDDKTGKLLPGATVNIGTGTSTLLTLTTGAKGTASGELPMSNRKAQFWVNSEGEAPYKFMAVPQGRTRQEWMSCYEQLVALPEIDVIGLSKLSVARSFEAPVAEARLECMAALLTRDAPKPFHLLGGDRSLPWELARHQAMGHDEAEHGGVQSNDSSFAFWYAAMDISVDSGGRARREVGSKPDLVAGTLTDERLNHALVNVAQLRRAAGLQECNPSSEPGGVIWQPQQ